MGLAVLRAVAILLAMALLAGCASTPDAVDGSIPEVEPALYRFSTPVQVNGADHGYEPSIAVDSAGTIYITAHKSGPVAPGQLSSWLWFSRDGATWERMPGVGGTVGVLPGVEGDLAIDAADHVYFVDTYAADETVTRWQGGAGGPTWEFSSPVQGTPTKDDRPWIEAHGDGIVYYLGNDAGAGLQEDPRQLSEPRGWIYMYTSTDGGMTWGLPQNVPSSFWFCGLAASKADDRSVHRMCNLQTASGADVVAASSSDRGVTWTEVGRETRGPRESPLYIASATDLAGTPYHLWLDDDLDDDQPAALRLGVVQGGSMTTRDLPIGRVAVWKQWVDAWAPGQVAIVYYTTPDVDTEAESLWYVRALLGRGVGTAAEAWQDVLLDPEPVAVGAIGPQDFFQCAYGPDGKLHVAYQRDAVAESPVEAFIAADILYVREL